MATNVTNEKCLPVHSLWIFSFSRSCHVNCNCSEPKFKAQRSNYHFLTEIKYIQNKQFGIYWYFTYKKKTQQSRDHNFVDEPLIFACVDETWKPTILIYIFFKVVHDKKWNSMIWSNISHLKNVDLITWEGETSCVRQWGISTTKGS